MRRQRYSSQGAFEKGNIVAQKAKTFLSVLQEIAVSLSPLPSAPYLTSTVCCIPNYPKFNGFILQPFYLFMGLSTRNVGGAQ